MKYSSRRWLLFLKDVAFELRLASTETRFFVEQYKQNLKQLDYTAAIETINLSPERIKSNGENIMLDDYKSYNKAIIDKFQKLDSRNKYRLDDIPPGNSQTEEIKVREEIKMHKEDVWRMLEKNYPAWESDIIGTPTITTSDRAWEELKSLAKYAPDRMGAYQEESIATLGATYTKYPQSQKFLQRIVQDTARLKFKVETEDDNLSVDTNRAKKYLILLNYDKFEVATCVCPSQLAPSSQFDRGIQTIPQAKSGYIKLGSDTLGTEEWWAWIVDEIPWSLSWINDARNSEKPVLQLNIQQLMELFIHARARIDGEILRTQYDVIERI